MKRIEDVRAVLLIYEQHHSTTDCDEIRMRNVETASVGNMNYERLKIWP